VICKIIRENGQVRSLKVRGKKVLETRYITREFPSECIAEGYVKNQRITEGRKGSQVVLLGVKSARKERPARRSKRREDPLKCEVMSGRWVIA